MSESTRCPWTRTRSPMERSCRDRRSSARCCCPARGCSAQRCRYPRCSVAAALLRCLGSVETVISTLRWDSSIPWATTHAISYRRWAPWPPARGAQGGSLAPPATVRLPVLRRAPMSVSLTLSPPWPCPRRLLLGEVRGLLVHDRLRPPGGDAHDVGRRVALGIVGVPLLDPDRQNMAHPHRRLGRRGWPWGQSCPSRLSSSPSPPSEGPWSCPRPDRSADRRFGLRAAAAPPSSPSSRRIHLALLQRRPLLETSSTHLPSVPCRA